MTIIDGLPPKARDIAMAMENGQMLGAARNIDAIIEILELVAADDSGDGTRVRETAEHFRRTRGAETAAVANSLDLLLEDLPDRDLATWVEAFGTELGRRQREWLQAICDTALDVLADAHVLLAYDYSSTVAEVLRRKIHSDGELELLIPESRTLDGGRPYVEELQALPARITFLADGAIGQMTRRADAVLEGVETLCEDGSFFNTIGSLTCAVCARYFDVPYYAITSTLKTAREADPADVKAGDARRFAETYGDFADVDTSYVENERVPASLVTGVITEQGLLAPHDVRAAAQTFFEKRPVSVDKW